jgi:hypothetical protein
MQIRVLGCSGSIAAGSRTTSFLLDDDILIDAGTGVGDLTLDEMARIDHILVSHSHLDHVLAIGLLADSVTRRRVADERPPVQVHALPQTIAALRAHVFNGVIWPDFTRLPSPDHPVLRFVPIEVGHVLSWPAAASRCCRPRTPCRRCGFAVLRRRRPAPGSTPATPGPTRRCGRGWPHDGGARWSSRPPSATTSTRWRASASTCARRELSQELASLTQPAEVYITHIKPGEVDRVMTRDRGPGRRPPHAGPLVSGQVPS